jgi:hypothetical protein
LEYFLPRIRHCLIDKAYTGRLTSTKNHFHISVVQGDNLLFRGKTIEST